MRRISSVAEVRARLIERREVALFDVREEGEYAQAHPLFAASLPLNSIELEVWERLPRKDVPIVVYDDGEELARRAVGRLAELGYSDISVLEGGLAGWQATGAELFRDVNVPSKAFGELVEARRHTPSIPAEELHAKLKAGENLVVLDARRVEEYQTMSIPTAASVPGGELVLRVRDIAPDPKTLVVVNCAGRTRSIIGAQSLVNAGVPNPVAALRNGTIGWTLAGLTLDRDASKKYPPVSGEARVRASAAARALADKAGALRIDWNGYRTWLQDPTRTVYRFDVRAPTEYEGGHLSGFRSAPGGQLVQETDVFAPVRGARMVLVDSEGVRANMAASWLAQMGWDVAVLDEDIERAELEAGQWQARRPPFADFSTIAPDALSRLMKQRAVTVIDLASSPEYARAHVPGAWWASRSDWATALPALPSHQAVALTSPDGAIASYGAAEFEAFSGISPSVVAGGTRAWQEAGLTMEHGAARLFGAARDVYKRPYEGTDNLRDAMQGYLNWEFGLVAQLARDDTHHFHVI